MDKPSIRTGAVVLAAGRSTRMGAVNKLLIEVEGVPMVLKVVRSIEACALAPVVVVTGHEHVALEALLADTRAELVHNPDFRDGQGTSLAVGIGALARRTDGVLVCLGDMPFVTAAQIARIVAAFESAGGGVACVPSYRGKWGNPVLLPSRFYPALSRWGGDRGARPLIEAHGELVREVPMDEETVLRDIDSPADLPRARRQHEAR